MSSIHGGSLTGEQISEIAVSLSIFRNGKRLESPSGEYDLIEFMKGWEISESIGAATLEAKFVFEDSAGIIGAMTGSEIFKLSISSGVQDRSYFLRSYTIEARQRTNQMNDMFIVHACSDEFLKNEVVNVFGHSDVIFKNKTESSEIVKTLLKDKRFIGSTKKLFSETTISKNQFIAPNWRSFDTIYWIAQRSTRKSKKGGTIQNGFAFYENAMGYNFKSIDKMVDDINDQKYAAVTDTSVGKAKLYTYEYKPKNIDSSADRYAIRSVVFPDEKNFLMGLRHGTWSGYSIGFDPNTVSNSKMGSSTDMNVDAFQYSLSSLWSKMSHLNGTKDINPIKTFDKDIQNMIDYPKRVRYTALPNQIFDPKYKNNPQKNYEQLVELQAYQWMRIESIKTLKLQIVVPGNLDLYAGHGVNVIIPSTVKSGSQTIVDKKYSGRYLIGKVSHMSTGPTMTTKLLLMKDTMFTTQNLVQSSTSGNSQSTVSSV